MPTIKDYPSEAGKQEIFIRVARNEDAAAITRLAHALAFAEGGHSLVSEASVQNDLLAQGCPLRILVAESASEVIGFVFFYPGYDLESASHGFHLADLVVEKAWRGHGIGTLLMREAARIVLEAKGEWLSWTVLKDNLEAQVFYAGLDAHTQHVHFLALGKQGLKNLLDK